MCQFSDSWKLILNCCHSVFVCVYALVWVRRLCVNSMWFSFLFCLCLLLANPACHTIPFNYCHFEKWTINNMLSIVSMCSFVSVILDWFFILYCGLINIDKWICNFCSPSIKSNFKIKKKPLRSCPVSIVCSNFKFELDFNLCKKKKTKIKWIF